MGSIHKIFAKINKHLLRLTTTYVKEQKMYLLFVYIWKKINENEKTFTFHFVIGNNSKLFAI